MKAQRKTFARILGFGVCLILLAYGRPAQAISASGTWTSVSSSDKYWDATVTQSTNGSIGGTVTIGGSSLVSTANVEGQLNGFNLAGVLLSQSDGQQLGTFSGTVSASGASGGYTFFNGDHGTWVWNGSTGLSLPTATPTVSRTPTKGTGCVSACKFDPQTGVIGVQN